MIAVWLRRRPARAAARRRACAASASGCRGRWPGRRRRAFAVGSTVAFDSEHPQVHEHLLPRRRVGRRGRLAERRPVDDYTRPFLRRRAAARLVPPRTSRSWGRGDDRRRPRPPYGLRPPRARGALATSPSATGARCACACAPRAGRAVLSLLVHTVVGNLTRERRRARARRAGTRRCSTAPPCAGRSTTTRRRPRASWSRCASPPGRACCCAPWTSATACRPQPPGGTRPGRPACCPAASATATLAETALRCCLRGRARQAAAAARRRRR